MKLSQIILFIENDETYQLDATIMIYSHKIGYKLTHSAQDYTPAS